MGDSDYERWVEENIDIAEPVAPPKIGYEDVPLEAVKEVTSQFLRLVGLTSYQQIQRRHLYEMLIAAYTQGYGAAINDARDDPTILEEPEDGN